MKIPDSANMAVFCYLKNSFSVAITEENTLLPLLKNNFILFYFRIIYPYYPKISNYLNFGMSNNGSDNKARDINKKYVNKNQ